MSLYKNSLRVILFLLLNALFLLNYSLAEILGIASLDNSGNPSMSYSAGPSLSAHGEKIAHLQGQDLRLYTRSTNTDQLLVSTTDGARPYMSANGNYIAYVIGGNTQIYDVQAGGDLIITQWGTPAFGSYIRPSLSADGKLLCVQKGSQVVLWDLHDLSNLGFLTLSNNPANNFGHCHISSNGQYAVFQNLDINEVLMYDVNTQSIIANFTGIDPSVTSNGVVVYSDNGMISVYDHTIDTFFTITNGIGQDISEDGRFVTFSTNNSLDGLDVNGDGDVYVYDRQTNQYKLLSIYNGIQSNGQIGDIKLEGAQIALSDDGSVVAMHGHGTNWFGNANDAQVFYAVNDFNSSVAMAVADIFTGLQDQNIIGNVGINDSLPSNFTQFTLDTNPIHGFLDFNISDGDFTYTPDSGRCNQMTGVQYIYPTDTLLSSGLPVTAFYALIDGNTNQEYFVNPSDYTTYLDITDEDGIRSWISSIPELVSHITYTYDSIHNIGVFDYINTIDPPKWVIYIGDSGGYDKKDLDGLYTGVYSGLIYDSFVYHIEDSSGTIISGATVMLDISCIPRVIHAVADTFSNDEDTILSGNIADNDILPTILQGFVIKQYPQNGTIINFNDINGYFEYTPNQDRCGVDASNTYYTFPTDTTSYNTVTDFYGLTDYANGGIQYWVDPSQPEIAHIPISDETGVRAWISSIPDVAENFTYTYDSIHNIGVFDFIGRGDPKWVMWIGDATSYFDKKDMNGQYRASGDMSDYFIYQFADQDGKVSNRTRAKLNIDCINDNPLSLSLSGDFVRENNITGLFLGTLSATDFDSSGFTYSLINGTGDTHNNLFYLSGNQLFIAISSDYENITGYSILVHVEDNSGGFLDQLFIISVIDYDDISPIVYLSGSSPLHITQGSGFIDPGVTWTDNKDGSGALNIPISGYINTFLSGVYVLEYTYVDAAGNTGNMVSRYIIVSPAISVTTEDNSTGNLSSGGGGGGGSSLVRDICPYGDFSLSYYDGTCGYSFSTGNQIVVLSGNIIPRENILDVLPSTITTNPRSCYPSGKDISIKNPNLVAKKTLQSLMFMAKYDLTSLRDAKEFGTFVTREEFARYSSLYAMNILCRKPRSTIPHYTDMSISDTGLQNYIILSYQLGLMYGDGGNGESTFRPKDFITEAEMMSVMAKMLVNSPLQKPSNNQDRYAIYQQVISDMGIKSTFDTNPISRNVLAQKLYDIYNNIPYILINGNKGKGFYIHKDYKKYRDHYLINNI